MDQYAIYQITIPLPFRLNHVHCYLAREGRKWTVIDTGLRNEETRKAWEKAFHDFGIDPERDINRIILTHHHSDHIGFAGEMQDWTQATVWMSDVTRHLALNVYSDTGLARKSGFYLSNGVTQENVASIEAYDREFQSRVYPIPQKVASLLEGQQLQIGELSYEVIHTPGHADGHLCFYNREEQVLLAGDHLLSRITPNISCHVYGEENPLESYFSSLKKVRDLDISLVMPGHGPIFYNAKARITEMMKHHEERLSITHQIVKEEMTAYEVSRHLFNRELTVHEQRSAIGETIAHLNYLVGTNELKKYCETASVWRYYR